VARGGGDNPTPSATFACRTSAASRSDNRELTHETRYALWMRILSFSISATGRITWTVSGPETCGVTRARSRVMRAA
jgi:hypothetical protein